MIRTLLVRGMAVGVVSGMLAFGMARVFGEPQIDLAIAFEEQQGAGGHDHAATSPDGAADAGLSAAPEAEEELVSRGVQSTVGLLTAVIVYGASFGGIFALVYAFALGRLGNIGPRGLAGLLALAGFVAIILVPFLKYPASPPAASDGSTISVRSGLFLAMIAISVGAMISAVLVARGRIATKGVWNAALQGGAVYIAIILAAQGLLPDIDEVPADFPATVLWRFRAASMGIQAVLWASIGLLFGYLTERSLQAERSVLRPAH